MALYSNHPALAFDVTWLAARNEQILDENLLNVGRRTSTERIAYLVLHMFMRAEEVGLTKGDTVQFPFTQQHLADTLGMSLVHTNKTLKKLVATKTMRWKDKKFEILDRDGPRENGRLRGCAAALETALSLMFAFCCRARGATWRVLRAVSMQPAAAR